MNIKSICIMYVVILFSCVIVIDDILETIHGLMRVIWLLRMNKLLKGKYLCMLLETIHGLMRITWLLRMNKLLKGKYT